MKGEGNERCYGGVRKYDKNLSTSEEGVRENAGGTEDDVVTLLW